MPTDWLAPPATLSKPGADVHLWSVRLDDDALSVEQCLGWLPLDEQERANRFKFPLHRRRFIISHAALRGILANYLAAIPRSILFVTNDHGKPRLADPRADKALAFNLSHSHEAAVIAVTSEGELGVDIEHVNRDFEFRDIAERFFTKSEVAAMRALPAGMQRQAFFKCWTAKEAFLKAKGTGLGGELDEVRIHGDAAGSVEITAQVPGWYLMALEPDGGYEAALVADHQRRGCRHFRWQPQSLNDYMPN